MMQQWIDRFTAPKQHLFHVGKCTGNTDKIETCSINLVCDKYNRQMWKMGVSQVKGGSEAEHNLILSGQIISMY